MRRYGVLGGTFDPIHVGHLAAAEWVRDACGLDQVLFVPAGIPPHKNPERVAPARHRFMMTMLGTITHPDFRVHRVDLDRSGQSYTVDTLAALQEELGEEVQLHFVLGADALADVPDWYQPERLLSEHRLIVAARPGWNLDEVQTGLGDLYTAYGDHIQAVEIPALDVSSSHIRDRVAAGRSIRYLVPDLVIRYIRDHQLYRTSL